VQILFSFFLLNTTFVKLVDEVPTSRHFYTVIFIIAVVFTVIPLFLNLFALNKIKSATIGILMYLNPIFNFTIALVVFDETINQLQMVGYAIILIALVLFNLHHFKRLQPSASSKV
jgi:chloramphenicol-sensitive protein RarD